MTRNLRQGDGRIRRETPGINRVSRLLFLCFLIVIVSACHYTGGTSTTLKDDGQVIFKRIAVVPFQRVSPEDAAFKTVRCPVCGLVFSAERLPGNSEKVVEDIFLEQVQRRKTITLIPPDRVGGIYERVSAGFLKADPLKVLIQTGKELGADGIVLGYVYRYKERKGYSYSAEKPASVAFEIHLIRVSDGVMVWRGIFDRAQTSLMENVLQISSFYKEGGRWVTAKELSEEGMEEILKNFPGFQKE